MLFLGKHVPWAHGPAQQLRGRQRATVRMLWAARQRQKQQNAPACSRSGSGSRDACGARRASSVLPLTRRHKFAFCHSRCRLVCTRWAAGLWGGGRGRGGQLRTSSSQAALSAACQAVSAACWFRQLLFARGGVVRRCLSEWFSLRAAQQGASRLLRCKACRCLHSRARLSLPHRALRGCHRAAVLTVATSWRRGAPRAAPPGTAGSSI